MGRHGSFRSAPGAASSLQLPVASVYLWTMPAWSVRTRGRHRIRHKATYVVVSNHLSQLDILVAFRLFFHFKWVSKEEVFKLPFIGWNMVLNRYIRLKRGHKKSVEQMMAHAEETLRRGSSVFFFPEGTRSRSGDLLPFKPGAFILAQKVRLPLLPIAISGTRDALPKHSLTITGRHRILFIQHGFRNLFARHRIQQNKTHAAVQKHVTPREGIYCVVHYQYAAVHGPY